MTDTPRPDDRRRGERERRVGEPVTQAQFYEAMDNLKEYILDRHRSMRDSMEVQFQHVREAMDTHAAEDRTVEKRVTTMEIRSEDRDKEVKRWGALMGAIFGTATVVVWDFIKSKFLH